jgi:lipopolysaccharide transport system permease protein
LSTEGRSTETIRLEHTSGFSRVLSPRELWRYRDLGLQIALRDVTIRYRQTALGAAWAVLQPVGFMLAFTLFFGGVAGIESNGIPYALFSLSALVPWTYFSTAMLLASESLVINSGLVSKIYFPRIFMPVGVVIAGCVDICVSFAILLVVVTIGGYPPTITLLALPLMLVIMWLTTIGISSGLAAVNVKYRDVRYVIPFAIQMWLFLTPIAYPNSLVPEPWGKISAINPMVGVVEGFRWSVLGTGAAPWGLIGISAASSVFLFALGLAYFDRAERSFADLI